MTLPAISTRRLELQPVATAHLPLLVELNADAEVMRHILGRPATPEETAAEWDQRLVRQSDATRGLGYWAGYVGEEFVGWWSASAWIDKPSVSGVGYRLRRTAWGVGLATEGARAMVTHAFTVPSVDRVFASTKVGNHASRAVLTKVGLVQVWEDDGVVGYEMARPLHD